MLLPQWDFTINPMFAHYMVMGEATTLAGRPITTLEDLRLLESQTLMEVNRRVVRPAPKNTRVFGPVIGGDFAPQHPGVSLREGLFEPSLRVSPLLAVRVIVSDGYHVAYCRARVLEHRPPDAHDQHA